MLARDAARARATTTSAPGRAPETPGLPLATADASLRDRTPVHPSPIRRRPECSNWHIFVVARRPSSKQSKFKNKEKALVYQYL